MQFIDGCVRNPVKVSVGVLLVALFGVISAITMPKQLTPNVHNPIVSVRTRWPGASPQEMEREIVQEQEEQLQSAEGLVKMSSECMDSEGRITLEFAVGTDLDQAILKVSTLLQQVREYPVDADEPAIFTSDLSNRSIARFVLTARPPRSEAIVEFQQSHPELKDELDHVLRAMSPGLMVYRLHELLRQHGDQIPELKELVPPEIDLQKVRRFAEDVIETRVERVPGVADAHVYGGREEELQVVVNPDLLAARGVTISDVRSALLSQNTDTSGGDFWEGKRRYVIRTLGQFRSPEDVREQLLAFRDNAPVYIGDVAEVHVGYKKPDSISRRYGISSNGLSVQAQSGANVLAVLDGLRDAARELNEGVLKRRGLELHMYYDDSEYIHSAISLVQQNIFIGGALTMIVLLLFLHRGWRAVLVSPAIAVTAVAAAYISPWFFLATLALVIGSGFWFGRGALVVGLAIPISIVGTFLLLGMMGRSLNVISLAGLAFAVGMLVDNAVVVLENIYRRHTSGESSRSAAVHGTAEVLGAVVASTLTTIAVFLPVLFVDEMAGQLFRDIALAISCAVGLSLVVSFAVIPTASEWLFGRLRSSAATRQLSDSPTRARGALRFIDSVATLSVSAIIRTNVWIQARTWRSLAAIGALVGLSLGLSYYFWPAVEYLPTGNRNWVFCTISPPPGYNMNQLMEMGEKIESDLKPYWDADPDEAGEKPILSYYFFVVRGRRVIMGGRCMDADRVADVIPLVRDVASQFPGTIAMAKQSSLFERGLTSGRTIDIEITGPDLEELVTLGQHVLERVNNVLPDAQAMPRPSLDLSSPEIHVRPRLVEAAEMAVNANALGYTVDALIDGAYAGDYFSRGDRVDLTIIGQESYASRTQDLELLPIATPSGQTVPLGAIAEIKMGSGPEQINRRERQRAITVQVTPPEEMPLEEAMDRIEAEILGPMHDRGEVRDEYLITMSGTADKLRDAWMALRWNVVLALAITYLLMAAIFESWLYPFVIIFSVPLGAVGGILGLSVLNLFVHQSLDVLTMLGFVILIGTVVNNAILIVHQSLQQIRRDGMSPRQAIPTSIRMRIRPIAITTMTTVLGLLPLVVFPGAGSELYRGLGSVVLGGLIVSTIFTLVLVPTVLIVLLDIRTAFRRLLGGQANVAGDWAAVELGRDSVIDSAGTQVAIDRPSPFEVEVASSNRLSSNGPTPE